MGAHNYSPEFVTAQVERYSWAVSAQPLNASDCSKRHEVEVRNLEFWRQQQRGASSPADRNERGASDERA